MTCIVPQDVKTKKALKELVAATHGMQPLIDEPNIVNPRSFYPAQMAIGESCYVTNHPKRSWFAEIKRTGANTFKVA